jgi:hypothetical protein
MTFAGSAQHYIWQTAAVNAWAEILSPAAEMRKTPAGKSALSGLALSMTMLCLFLSSVLPTNKLFFLAGSSIFTAVVRDECGFEWSLFLYIAASLLVLWLLPLGPWSLAYILFFGNWGLVRSSLGKSSKFLAVILKLSYFNLMLFVLYRLLMLLGLKPTDTHPIILFFLWMASQLGMLLYDWAYELFLSYFRARFQTK